MLRGAAGSPALLIRKHNFTSWTSDGPGPRRTCVCRRDQTRNLELPRSNSDGRGADRLSRACCDVKKADSETKSRIRGRNWRAACCSMK